MSDHLEFAKSWRTADSLLGHWSSETSRKVIISSLKGCCRFIETSASTYHMRAVHWNRGSGEPIEPANRKLGRRIDGKDEFKANYIAGFQMGAFKGMSHEFIGACRLLSAAMPPPVKDANQATPQVIYGMHLYP